MKLNSKLTGGLAWAGLILVLAVPSADMLTKPQGDSAKHLTSDMDAVRTASITPEEPAAIVPASIADPVGDYASSGKKLPSYISDVPAETAATEPATTPRLIVPSGASAEDSPAEVASTEPATTNELVVPSSTETDETSAIEVAAVEDAPVMVPQIAPVPYPISLRPKTPVVRTPVVTTPVTDTATATTFEDDEAPLIVDEAPLIVDEDVIARREAAVDRVLDEDDELDERDTAGIVQSEELEEWDSGSLAEYLERRGLMSGNREQASRSEFDEDGFFLDDGPNDDDDRRVVRRLRRNNDFFFF